MHEYNRAPMPRASLPSPRYPPLALAITTPHHPMHAQNMACPAAQRESAAMTAVCEESLFRARAPTADCPLVVLTSYHNASKTAVSA